MCNVSLVSVLKKCKTNFHLGNEFFKSSAKLARRNLFQPECLPGLFFLKSNASADLSHFSDDGFPSGRNDGGARRVFLRRRRAFKKVPWDGLTRRHGEKCVESKSIFQVNVVRKYLLIFLFL